MLRLLKSRLSFYFKEEAFDRRNMDLERKKHRYEALDSIRGAVLISMILYHACWDLVYIFEKDFGWYQGHGAYIWQQSICWTFILLSGFCWSLGKEPVRRGIIVFMAGAVVSLVTIIFMPEDRVIFGVLTLIGSCMLLMVPIKKVLEKVDAGWGFFFSILLFVLTRNVNKGYLGFEGWNLIKIPEVLYRGNIMTFLGFAEPDFFSTDYFSLMPWFFLFLSGYFLYCMIGGNIYRRDTVSEICDKQEKKNKKQIMDRYLTKGWKPLSFLGKNSLIIYLIHQPVIYGIFVFLDRFSLL